MRAMWWTAAVTLVLDQVSKFYVLAGLGLDTRKAIDRLKKVYGCELTAADSHNLKEEKS